MVDWNISRIGETSAGYNNYYSRSYAEDVTSVTSGASQGPHSFNLVFVCVTPGDIPYLSRTVPYQQRQLATIFLFVCAIGMPGAIPYLSRIIKRMSIYAKCIGGMHSVQ